MKMVRRGRRSFIGKFVFLVLDPMQRTLEASSRLYPVCPDNVAGTSEQPHADDDVSEEDIRHENEDEPNDHKNIQNHCWTVWKSKIANVR